MPARTRGLVFLACALLACGKGEGATTTPEDDERLIEEPAPAGESAEVAVAVPRPPATIYRSEVERATSRGPAYLLRQLEPLPHREGGRFAGWEVTRVFPSDPTLCTAECDLRPGDVIQSVNGSRLERPEQLQQLMESLPAAAELTVVRKRDGQATTRVYTIAPDPT